MTKIEVFDLETDSFKYEEFVVNSDNYLTTAVAYCKVVNTQIDKKIGNAVILANRTILNLSKISKFNTRQLTMIGV